jgi:hypothetical protein
VKERRERRERSRRATAKGSKVDHEDENISDEFEEDEREVCTYFCSVLYYIIVLF